MASKPKSNILRLHLLGVYFDAIKQGTKTEEFRLHSTWWNRIAGRTFAEIHLLRGYPAKGDTNNVIRCAWAGYTVKEITHPHFGPEPVRVIAFDVTQKIGGGTADQKPQEQQQLKLNN